jgi:hypothetical protein
MDFISIDMEHGDKTHEFLYIATSRFKYDVDMPVDTPVAGLGEPLPRIGTCSRGRQRGYRVEDGGVVRI